MSLSAVKTSSGAVVANSNALGGSTNKRPRTVREARIGDTVEYALLDTKGKPKARKKAVLAEKSEPTADPPRVGRGTPLFKALEGRHCGDETEFEVTRTVAIKVGRIVKCPSS